MLVEELRRVVASAGGHGASAGGHAASQWLDAALREVSDATQLRMAFASAGRRVGTTAIGDDAAARIEAAGLTVPASAGLDEVARAALLLAAASSKNGATNFPATSDGKNGATYFELVRDLLRRGEVRERQAVLRTLAALPEPQRFVELAIDACRTNVLTIFEAIACDNAYPAGYFPEAAFNQMVLKALFIGAPVARIRGLADRTTNDLVRMVEAYASERRAAGRPIPEDAALIKRKP